MLWGLQDVNGRTNSKRTSVYTLQSRDVDSHVSGTPLPINQQMFSCIPILLGTIF